MPTRRAHGPRNTHLPAHLSVSSPPRLLSAHTFTLIGSWRGQLLICSVVLVVGAIYFVVREPIRQWRRRQRERLSRALTAELLYGDKQESSAPSSDKDRKDRPSSSKCVSTTLPTPKTARERGREKRKEAKEKKRHFNVLRVDSAADTGAPTSSSIDSSPTLAPVRSIESATDTTTSQTTNEGGERSQPQAIDSDLPKATPPTITLDSTPSDTEETRSKDRSASSTTSSPHTQPLSAVDSPQAGPSRLASTLEVDLSTDGDHPSSRPASTASQSSRPPYSREPSSSYSIMPEEGYLPMMTTTTKKKNKRKSKARGGTTEAPRNQEVTKKTSISALRTVNMSSDDASSPRSVSAILSAPGSPQTPRRRMKPSIGGVPMSPALDLLLTNHERTIDSLRAEIGHAKAEESKARDDEVRAREELRRSRATEDRMRSDYERARKARDRAENETRRMEAEMLLMRNRLDTLSHMYNAVCHRLREFEMAHASQDNGPPSAHPLHSPALPPSPFVAYTTANGMQVGFMPYPNTSMYGSPIATHGGYPMHPPVSPSPLRRTDGTGSSDLAGPLTPGLGPGPSATGSQLSSPFPSDLTINTSSTSGPSSVSAHGGPELSAVELRRLHIASSVLKKKTPTSESGDSNPNSTRVSEPATEATSDSNPVAGLGITQLSDVSSTFPSVNSPASRPNVFKQGSVSSSSEASSAPPGRQILITPSNSELYHHSTVPESLTITTDTSATFVREPDNVDEVSTESQTENETEGETKKGPGGVFTLERKTECLNSINDHNDTDAAGDSDFVPMFASLAHTPEQLAEIARMRESAIRERERRSRQRSTDSHDL